MSGAKKLVFIVVGLFVLSVLYYTISPLFRVIEVNDVVPENIITKTDTLMPSGFENLSTEEQKDLTEEMERANETEALVVDMEMDVQNMHTTVVFEVMGTVGHPASGSVRVLETVEGRIIRYEDFETINGPKLHIYLSKDLGAEDFIDLGPIKGTRGNINYSVLENVDLSEYRYVMYWCVPFGVLFNYADLHTT